MKKILMPIDGTERSLQSLDFVKNIFPKDSVEITLMNVKELVFTGRVVAFDEMKYFENTCNEMLEKIKERLKEYKVDTYFSFGYPGKEIIEKSIEGKYDVIVMTKSTKNNFIDSIGSVTAHVVKKAKCTVIIVPEYNKKYN
ncbi:universal stress protein [Romboutsia sp. MSSM.1001216sp_RTP31141st1_G3_RTP31141_220114]|uniref:universal stress protein n=1 Tax=unclassified Romboutsia TaxID=2626894 RepID=UPI0031B6478F